MQTFILFQCPALRQVKIIFRVFTIRGPMILKTIYKGTLQCQILHYITLQNVHQFYSHILNNLPFLFCLLYRRWS